MDTHLSLLDAPGKGSDQTWQATFQPWAGRGQDAANAQVALQAGLRAGPVRRAPAGGGELVPEGLTQQAGQGARMWLGGSLLSWRRRGPARGGVEVVGCSERTCWSAGPPAPAGPQGDRGRFLAPRASLSSTVRPG